MPEATLLLILLAGVLYAVLRKPTRRRRARAAEAARTAVEARLAPPAEDGAEDAAKRADRDA